MLLLLLLLLLQGSSHPPPCPCPPAGALCLVPAASPTRAAIPCLVPCPCSLSLLWSWLQPVLGVIGPGYYL